LRELLGIALFLAASSVAHAATVSVDHGNIVVDGKAVTSGGHDSDPVLSPDGIHIVFGRHAPAPTSAMADCLDDNNESPKETVSMWVVNADGTHATKLLQGGADTPQGPLCDFSSKQFNSTGRLLYFQTQAWATSDAIHVFDMTTKTERRFVPGNSLLVLASCKDEHYRDYVAANQHRYFVFGGTYNWTFLFTPEGKEVGPVSDSDDLSSVDM
jgi:hypothetical protein